MEGQLIASIQENLAMYLLENAIFLGERLVADFPSEVCFQLDTQPVVYI